VLRTVASRLLPADIASLAMRGAQQAGPAPGGAALLHRNGAPVLDAGQTIEVDCKVQRDGHVPIAGGKCQVGFGLAGSTVVMWLDGHFMHAIAVGALPGAWPCPVTADRAAAPAAAARRIHLRPAARARQRPDHGQQAAHQARAPARRETRHRRHRGLRIPTSPNGESRVSGQLASEAA
jgi:hypothetical protein